jgi:hypothetical protein
MIAKARKRLGLKMGREGPFPLVQKVKKEWFRKLYMGLVSPMIPNSHNTLSN